MNSFGLFNTRRLPYMLFLGAVFCLFSGVASADTINVFNDSHTYANLNLSIYQNMVYINSSRNIDITSLTMTLSGFPAPQISNLTGNNVSCEEGPGASMDPCYLANDGLYSSGGINMANGKWYNVFWNWTPSDSNIDYINVTIGFYQQLNGYIHNISVYDYNGKVFHILNSSTGNDYVTGTYFNRSFVIYNTGGNYWGSGKPLYIRAYSESQAAGHMTRVVEGDARWLYYPYNVSVDINNDGISDNSTAVLGNGTQLIVIDPSYMETNIYDSCTANWADGWCITEINISEQFGLGFLNITGVSITFTNLSAIIPCSAEGAQLIANFTFMDETNLTYTTGDYEYSMTTDRDENTYNASGDDVWYFDVCINNYTVTTDMILQYDQTGYDTRYYFLDNATLDVTNPTYVTLYMINENNGTEATITTQSAYSYPLPYTYVQFQRYYIGENKYRTVAMAKTDDTGSGKVNLYVPNTWYKYILTKDGTVLGTIGPKTINSDTIILSLLESTTTTWYSYNSTIQHSCMYNDATNYLSCTMVDTTGTTRQFCLNTHKYNIMNLTLYATVCDTGSSVTLMTNMSAARSLNNSVVYRLMVIDSDGNKIILEEGSVENGYSTPYGLFGVFLTLMIFCMAAFLGIWNPAASIIMGIGGIWACVALSLITIPAGAFGSLLMVAVIYIIMVRT